tara:strand:- start:11 stop:859 length:849 start_codon:yes stop_codon:yes gene_type:complete
MPILKFKNPLTITGSDGFISNILNMDGTVRQTNVLEIGQDIGTDQDVTFNSVESPENQTLIINNEAGTQNMVLGYEFISGSNLTFTVDTMTISENFTHENDITINGKFNAPSMSVELNNSNIIFQSGSTKFGDDLNDTHSVTGSMSVSGSFNLNGTDLIEISNNSDVTAARSNVLITENAAKAALGGDIELNNQYMRKIFAHTGSISNSTASFSAVTASVDTDLTSTTKQDFQFYLNGMLLEQDALTIQQSSSVFELHMNASSLGYNLSNSDEIVAWGKFNS